MANNIGGIFNNSLEDGIDDYISTVLFQQMRKVSQPLKDKFESDSAFDGAMQNFITTLTMGLTIYAYLHAMEIIRKYLLQNVSLWAYIVTGKIKNKIGKLAQRKIKGKVGKVLLRTVLDTDKTSERIQIAQIINDNFNHIDKKMQDEKYTRLKIEDRITKLGYSSAVLKGVSNESSFNLFFYKTKTGTWNATKTDKELFEAVTGQDIQTAFGKGWNALYTEFNKYKEYAQNSQGEIFNITEALLKTVNRSQIMK